MRRRATRHAHHEGSRTGRDAQGHAMPPRGGRCHRLPASRSPSSNYPAPTSSMWFSSSSRRVWRLPEQRFRRASFLRTPHTLLRLGCDLYPFRRLVDGKSFRFWWVRSAAGGALVALSPIAR
ncbi:hypothetical protein BHE74_00002836 [Ensete ventricosum]|nr:hypothetical protein BHE74_00002836 [Ensete ventricosum]